MTRLKVKEKKIKNEVTFTQCFLVKIWLSACIWKLISSVYLAAVPVLLQ